VSFELTIEPLGISVDIEEGQTILDAALRAGIYLPHACCHGVCATCKVDVTDGEVEHNESSSFALMEFERDEGKCLACCATVESDITISAEIEEDPDARAIPVRDFQAVVTRIKSLTPTIKGVWLKLSAGQVFDFQAGQYINLKFDAAIGSRAFSVASSPSEGGEIELNIKIVPGGAATSFVHEQLKVGDEVTFSGPYGRFFVKKSADLPVIFIAGGSGLSSPRSMILDLVEEGFEKPIALIYGQRNFSELYYHEDFKALEARLPNFTYVPVLSDEPGESEWSGARGFAHDAAKAHFDNDFRGHKAYLCGPPAMIEATISTLMQGRLFERDIYTEKFISAADAQQVRSPLFKSI